MEVTNSWSHWSHDHTWRMRPAGLNSDPSATSRTLPQRGHLGRPRSWVKACSALAQWLLIVAPPRRPLRTPDAADALHIAGDLWRRHDAFVKLSWPGRAGRASNRFTPELANSGRQAFSFAGPRASPRPQNWGNQESVCKAWSVISPAMDHQSWLLLRVMFRLSLFLAADIG